MEPAAQVALTVEPKTTRTTRDRLGPKVAGVDSVEVKMTVADAQIDRALKKFDLTEDNDEEHRIYFFDTPELDLLEGGIIARARRIKRKPNTTVKFRPVNPFTVPRRWARLKGFKLEADASEKGVDRSASLTLRVKRGLIGQVIAGELGIGSLFNDDHADFLSELGGEAFRKATGRKTIEFDRLTVFGPIKAQRWRVEKLASPWPVIAPWAVTAELWQRMDRKRLMEFSMKCEAPYAAFAIAGFGALLDEVGVERNIAEKSKTRWALYKPA
jgi:hypothetical protein